MEKVVFNLKYLPKDVQNAIIWVSGAPQGRAVENTGFFIIVEFTYFHLHS
jgi:hypothetical protein